MRITRRDVLVAAGSAALAWSALATAQGAPARLGPAVFDWTAMTPKKTETGEVRSVVRQPTATLRELEMHVSTLNPGIASHPPHRHPNEELVLIDRGTVEVLSDGKWRRIGPGSVVFNASNALHALRNVGSTPAQYHVVNWTSGDTPAR